MCCARCSPPIPPRSCVARSPTLSEAWVGAGRAGRMSRSTNPHSSCLRVRPMATVVVRSTCSRSQPTLRSRDVSAWRRPPRSRAARVAGSTKAASSSTTRCRRCTRVCAAPTRMPRSTGSVAWSTAVATRAISRGASCAWRSRTSGSPTRAGYSSPSTPGPPTTALAARRVNSRSPMPSSISLVRRRATPSTRRSRKRMRMCRSSARSRCRCRFAMRPPRS